MRSSCLRSFRLAVSASLLALLAAIPAVAQQSLTWDANGAAAGTGGTGTWNTTLVLWDNAGVLQAWNNGAVNNAVFAGTAGTVTLGVGITAHNLSFGVAGFTVAGNTLTLGGTTPTVSVVAGATTISSAITGIAGLTTAGAGSLTLSGVNSYSGGLTLNGTGTVILSNANTYTGATTIAGGTLQIGNGGTTGALAAASAIVNDGTLILNRSNAVTFANTISGSGGLTKLGAGVTSLTGTNSYSGVTTIVAGTLSVGNGGTTGDLGVSSGVINDATLRINRSDAITLAQDISGSGALTKQGAGTATLTGTNTYTGTTTITAGTLEVGDGGTSGSLGPGNVTVTGGTTTLQSNRSDTVTLGQVISGTGRFTQAGTGTVVLTGANTYSGTTTIAAGTLQLGAGGTTGSLGTGAIANSGVLVIDRSDAVTLTNVISGTGALRQAGAGTTTLTGTSTYTGTTTIAGGALQIGNGGTTGALAAASAIVNDGTLILNRSNNVTFANATSGSGGLTKLGAGITSLTGTNSYSGVTAIVAGTLSVGNGGTTGDLGVSSGVINDATLRINRSDAITLAQDISGSGALTKQGAGTATLTGTNTYTGTTTITAGTLEVGDGGTSGSLGTGNVTVTGGTTTLQSNRSDTVTLGQVISGTGRFTQAGTGTVVLTAANTYSGTTTIAAGTLQLGAGGTTGSLGTGAIANSGVLVIDRSDALTLTNVISGTGALRQAGAGTTTLTGTSTYTGTTTIAGGALQIGNGGTTGALAAASAIVNDGTLILNRSNNVTFANTISGSGAVTKMGTGVTSLTGTNSYSGVTTITAGTLSVGNGGTTGDLGATSGVMNNATLRINRSNAITLSQDISGSGALTKLGAGTATLTGTNTYTGTTTITGGTLIVNGSLASSALTANNGTTLGGVGTIAGAVTINSGATLAPGVSPGTLTVGSLNLSSGSLLAYELATPGVVGGGVNDLIVVTGDLTLAGTMNVTSLPGFGFGTYRLVNYGGAFTDNVLQLGTVPLGYFYQLLTTTAGQIDLVVDAPALQFWSGGSGTWAAGLPNWTDVSATTVLPWGGRSAVFGGPGGTITVDGPLGVRSIEFRASHLLTSGIDASLDFGTSMGTLAADAGVTATIGVSLRGSGGLTIQGAGTVVLDAANVYTGGTVVDQGTLVVSSDANLGSSVDGLTLMNGGILHTTANLTSARTTTIDNGGTLDIAAGTTLLLTGDVNGSGALAKAGGGTLTLTGANTYSGGTLVAGGTLRGSAGLQGSAGSLQGDVVNNADLVFDQRADGLFHGTLFGSGRLLKVGAGTLSLEGAHALQGLTTVAEGTLALNGSLAGSVSVEANGVLRATGTIGGTLDVDGVVNVPLDVLGVLGSVVFNPGSQLTVAIDATGGSAALVTTGTASIQGATIAVQPLGGTLGRVTHAALLQADGGLMGSASATPAGALEPFLSQNSTTLFATVLRMDLPLEPYATSPGGSAVAAAIDRVKGAATGDLARGIRELTALEDAELGAALDMVGGEIHAATPLLVSLEGEGAADTVREQIANRLTTRAQMERNLGQAADRFSPARSRRAWFRLRGERSVFESATAHRAHVDLNGFITGVDWTRPGGWLVGVGGSFTRGGLFLNSLDQSSRVSTPRAMAYASRSSGRWGVDAGLGVARTSQDVQRRLAFVAFAPTGRPLLGGVDRTATSHPSGLAIDAWGQGRFIGVAGAWSVLGTAGVRRAHVRMNAWQEAGAQGLSLSADDQLFTSTQTDTRLQLTRSIGRVAPWLSASYKRELAGRAASTLRIGEASGGTFRIDGPPLPRATAIGVAGVRFAGARADISMAYEVRRADRQMRHVVQLGFGFE